MKYTNPIVPASPGASVRRTIGTLTAEVASVPIPEGPMALVIEGNEPAMPVSHTC